MMWGNPGYGYGGEGSWLGMLVMMFFGLLFLAGLVLLVVWLARSGGGGGGAGAPRSHSATSEACDIAKLRYARGEITKDQFEEICRTVGG